MSRRSRRHRHSTPPHQQYGYGRDSRGRMVAGNRQPPPPPPDYDDPHYTGGPPTSAPPPPPPPASYELSPTQTGPTSLVDPYLASPFGYRDHRNLPSTYRATLRNEPPLLPYPPLGNTGDAAPPAPYKILCITNINPKVSDGPVKDALVSDFSRFGDISVSICHDSGERLAYIYFRTYEEAREAKHVKARTLLFDRPIEIEPIYEPRSSPGNSPPPPSSQTAHPLHPLPPQPIYSRRRSMTPPEYYGASPLNGPLLPSSRRPPPPPAQHHGGMTPPDHSPHSSRYFPGPLPPMHPNAPIAYGDRYYLPPAHLPSSAYPNSPPHDPYYRTYQQHRLTPPPLHHPSQYPPNHSPYHHPSYGPIPHPSIGRERERSMNHDIMGGHLTRSPRHESYYQAMEQRGYGPPPPMSSPHHSIRGSSSSHHHHDLQAHQLPHQSTSRRTPPLSLAHTDHPRGYLTREYRREKYGSENYGNEPEEGRPSRVLFVSNIYSMKTESELRDIFEPFGNIEEIELRKISPDVSSALIKFSSMDCAYKAKTAINGKYMGNLKCRIIYGKVSASRRLWIGGLGPTTTVTRLEDEFGKFGDIINMDYTSGRPYAYVEFESANQAQFATHYLKGSLVAGAERKIRIEFVDPTERNDKTSKPETSLRVSDISSRSRTTTDVWERDESNLQANNNLRKRSITPTPDAYCTKRLAVSEVSSNSASKVSEQSLKETGSSAGNKSNRDDDKDELNNNLNSSGHQSSNSISVELADVDRQTSSEGSTNLNFNRSKSIRDIVECCPVSWFGQLVLRNFNFPSKMFMFSGQKATIEKYITNLNGENGDSCPILRITQRWRLHPQPKLEEVKRRMQSGNLGMLIITSKPTEQSPSFSSPSCKTPQSSNSQQTGNTSNDEQQVSQQQNGKKESEDEKTSQSTGTAEFNESSSTQSRPLKNLISYLEQKDAAGVISLTALDGTMQQGVDTPKLLYTFPPCEFALNLLRQKAPSLSHEATTEEFLLGVIIGSSETKM